MRLKLLITFMFVSHFIIAQIMVDGSFDDWEKYEKIDVNENNVEYIKLIDDKSYLYLLVSLENEIKFNAEKNYILVINTDENTKTGRTQYGFDIAFDFSHKKGVNFSSTNGELNSSYSYGIHYLPTTDSKIFEIAIAKDSILNSNINNLDIGFFNGIKNIDKIEPSNYILSRNNYKLKAVKIHKKKRKTLRFMTYNVLHDGIIKKEQQDKIMSIIKTINPDIITLNECWDVTPDTITKIFIHSFPNSTWHATKNDEGNITVSKYPIIKSINILKKARITANYIKVKNDTLIVINSHFRCCENDKRRKEEVIAVANYIELTKKKSEIKNSQQYPIIVMGDFNFVGDSDQLFTLLNGVNTKPDWDNTELTNLKAFQSGSNFSYTWYDETSDYSPGKLDFIIYSDSRLEAKKAFVFNSVFLSEKYLKKYKFSRELSKKASDHLPVVVDFKIKKTN
jgi:endonuclease/exonuclease/phosphatase family metal-dependent hydrolase